MADYADAISMEFASGVDAVPLGRYNIAPTTQVAIFRHEEDGVHIERTKWGWSPVWAKGKRPDPINARAETVSSGRFFKQLWPRGRIIVAVDFWYEWVTDPNDAKKKQPWLIHLRSGGPMLLAGLAEIHHGSDSPNERDGFVIITAAADQGMVDIHDRKPLVLTSDLAREWIDLATPVERVEEILHTGCRSAEDFSWYPVSKDVGNVRNQGAHLIEAIDVKPQGDLFSN